MLKSLLTDLRKSFRKPATADSLVQDAHEHLEAGRFSHAIPLLEQALANSPQHASALNLLGFAFSQIERLDEARALIEQAIALNPKGRGYHSNLGEALRLSGHITSAERAFRREIELVPDYGQGYMAYARFLAMNGRHAEALKVCKQASRALPEFAEAHMQVAIHSLVELKDYRGTLKTLEQVLEHHPEHSGARLLKAKALLSLSDFPETERTLRKLVQDEPDNVAALIGLGHLMLLVAEGTEAEACFRLALGIEPDNAQAARYLTSLMLETGQLEQAADILTVFARDYPDDIAFCRCAGRLALLQDKLEEAISHFEHALQLAPADIDSIEQIANINIRLAKDDEALRLLRHAISLDPQRQMTRYNNAFALLLSGNFKQGLVNYEARLKIAYEDGTPYDLRSSVYSAQEAMKEIAAWDGKKSLKGKRIVVWREQGLGDALMMMRFIVELRKRGAGKICVVAHPELMTLTSLAGVADEVISSEAWRKTMSAGYDFHCSMMSLAHLVDASPSSLGKYVPYLQVPEERARHWQHIIAEATKGRPAGKLKVGLVWAGNPGISVDKARSIALNRLSPLVNIPGIVWFSLQKGPAQSQLKKQDWPILDLMDQCTDFVETASQVVALDLVITVDTAMVHLTGALGKPVWMFNRASSEWRWMRNREDSPWYPSLKLFNQQQGEAWEPVIERMATDLTRLVAARQAE